MALEKQSLLVNFALGLDLKTDPKQVQPGNFLALENTVFNKGGLLQKRNGFQLLGPLPNTDATYLTTFAGNLTAIGESIQAYSDSSDTWVNKGELKPISVDTLSLIRSSTNQSQADTAVSDNGLVCIVYTDNLPAGGLTTPSYKYAVADAVTGQNIVAPTVIPVAGGAASGSPRVFVLGKYFIIVFNGLISATNHLRYITINTATLAVSTGTDISTNYSPSTTGNFDAVVANNKLYVAWNGADVGGAVRVASISSTLVQSSTVVFATSVATLMSVTADLSGSTPIVWVSFYDSGTSTGYSIALSSTLVTLLAPTQFLASGTVNNLTSSARAGVATVFYEVDNDYSYNTVNTNYVVKKTVTQAGVVSSATTVSRSVGLASKSFILDETMYFLAVQSSTFQPTYFLLDSSGNVLAKLAYTNGGPYYTLGLPSVSVTGSVAEVSYLIKDSIQAVNKDNGAASPAGVYSQTGINHVSFDLGMVDVGSAEIGQNLNLTGGFLWGYDGYAAVENGFFLYPENVVVSTNTGVTPTGNTTDTSTTITNLSATTSVGVGCTITGTGIQADTVITAVNGTTITISKPATATGTGVTLTIKGLLIAQQYYYVATYEWADNQGNVFRSAPSVPVTITSTTATSTCTINVPTLRLTYKTANPAKIVIYRWSVAQPTYYQVTSITSPILNDKTIDSVSFVDSHSDAQILGNNILYTTGGVVENTGAPATDSLTLYRSRLFLVDSEDKNLLWYSKQVIEATPVEMSDLFTIYVGPTSGAQGSTGDITALSALDDKLIIFKQDAIYYLVGNGPDNTGANNDFSEPVFITATVGCSNKKSIVFIPQGLMFQSDKGIWLLGRDLSTSYIGAPVDGFNPHDVESAVNIPGTNQVRFTLSNGVTLMYDYYYNQWGSFTGIPGISSTLYQSLHTFINSRGEVLQENVGNYLDGSSPVLVSFTTGWMSLAGLKGYQRAYFFYILGTYYTPHKLTVGISYDYNEDLEQVSLITPDNFSPAYGGDSIYGGGEVYGGPIDLEQWRIFFERQKCEAFRISITESFDPSFGASAGAGFDMSALNIVVGMKKSYSPIKAANSVG